MHEFKDFAISLAHQAGTLLMEKFDKSVEIRFKGEINLVTEADKMSENLIISAIRKKYSDHGILSEESPAIISRSSMRWIIDPLDGTTNYAHNLPIFCVSIALEKDGIIVLGVIYDPTRRDTFVALRGEGAYRNGKRLNVSHTSELTHSLLATGFPYDIRESKENNLNYFNVLAKEAQAVRRTGSAAIDIAYVAAGRFDGFWELKLQPWDVAAGSLIIEEAGGKIADINGGSWNLSSSGIVISNGKIHEQLLGIIRKVQQAGESSIF